MDKIVSLSLCLSVSLCLSLCLSLSLSLPPSLTDNKQRSDHSGSNTKGRHYVNNSLEHRKGEYKKATEEKKRKGTIYKWRS